MFNNTKERVLLWIFPALTTEQLAWGAEEHSPGSGWARSAGGEWLHHAPPVLSLFFFFLSSILFFLPFLRTLRHRTPSVLKWNTRLSWKRRKRQTTWPGERKNSHTHRLESCTHSPEPAFPRAWNRARTGTRFGEGTWAWSRPRSRTRRTRSRFGFVGFRHLESTRQWHLKETAKWSHWNMESYLRPGGTGNTCSDVKLSKAASMGAPSGCLLTATCNWILNRTLLSVEGGNLQKE